MESIEKLRYYIDHGIKHRDGLIELADEIEREILERYMELPVDAEGAPIHVDDVMAFNFGTAEVCGVCKDEFFILRDNRWMCLTASKYQHAKTRTLEDVLREFGEEFEVLCQADAYPDPNNPSFSYERELKKLIAEHAAEIRELLGGDGR